MKRRKPRTFFLVRAVGPERGGLYWDVEECGAMAHYSAKHYKDDGYDVETIETREVLKRRRKK